MVEPLIEFFNAGRWTEEAASALGRLGDRQAVEPLIAGLNQKYKTNTLAALGKLGWTPLVAKQMLYMVMTWNREGNKFMTHLHNQYGREDEIRARFHNPWVVAQVFVVQQTYEHSADMSDRCKACERLAQTRIKTELSRQNPINSYHF